jgi:hypothetical protein
MEQETRLRAVSICFSDLLEYAKANHPAFSRGKNSKIYVNVAIWDVQEDKVQYGNNVSMQLSPPKSSEAIKNYVGNGKKIEMVSGNTPIGAKDLAALPDEDDLPF